MQENVRTVVDWQDPLYRTTVSCLIRIRTPSKCWIRIKIGFNSVEQASFGYHLRYQPLTRIKVCHSSNEWAARADYGVVYQSASRIPIIRLSNNGPKLCEIERIYMSSYAILLEMIQTRHPIPANTSLRFVSRVL